MRKLDSVDYAGHGDPMQCLDAYLPDEKGFDTLIYMHGGGLERGDRNKCQKLLPLVEKNIAVVSPEYRMFPSAKFPEFIEDAAVCVRFVLDHVKEWGGNGRVFVSGGSAGAWLTMMLAMDTHYLENAGVKQSDIAGYISESAQQFAHFAVMNYSGQDGRLERIDETAPIYFVREGMEMRPMFLIWYTNDMWCRPEENRLMKASLERFLPEDGVLDALELTGKHCKPERPEELLAAFEKFIHKEENHEQVQRL